jgi:hypothetical protein
LSNTYTHVAFAFDAATPENAGKIQGLLRRSDFCGELEQQERVLFIASECADVSLIAELLGSAMRALPEIPSPQGFEWAFAGDKH